MAYLVKILAALFLLAGCSSGDGAGTEFTTTPTASPTTAPTTTTTAPTTTTTTTTTIPDDPATTTTVAGGIPEFTIRMVVFGDLGFVAIQNVGTGTGSLSGLYLCQFPDYFPLPDVALAPSEQIAVAAGDGAGLDLIGFVVTGASGGIGALTADGEMALYRGSNFGDPEAIDDYVEWGASGHARSGVAVTAGIWPEGGFVDVPEESLLIGSISNVTTGPDDWTAEFGG